MPQRITVELYMPSQAEYWTNRYFTTDAVNAAGDTIDGLAAAYYAIGWSDIMVTKIRIDDNVENTDNYDTVTFNQFGSNAIGSEQHLPLFNVARVDFDVAGGGRPSRKYLRGLLTESGVTFTSLGSTTLTGLNSFGDAIVALGTICDPQGNLFVDAVPWPAPAMRQLRRGSKKSSTL